MSRRGTLMVLGAGVYQVPGIRAAVARGLHVVMSTGTGAIQAIDIRTRAPRSALPTWMESYA
jgi:hypothetical protein